MTDLAPALNNCILCRHPVAESIDRHIRDHGIGETMRWMAAQGMDVPHRNTFSKHKNVHLTDEYVKQRMEAIRNAEKKQQTIRPKSGDLAALVRDNVFARVEAGALEPSLAEGLRAQEMLDRRQEKQGDRDMMLTLAGLLSGATPPVALLADGNTVEGEWRDADERAEDEAAFVALLGPG